MLNLLEDYRLDYFSRLNFVELTYESFRDLCRTPATSTMGIFATLDKKIQPLTNVTKTPS